jgi:hypothetical protein
MFSTLFRRKGTRSTYKSAAPKVSLPSEVPVSTSVQNTAEQEDRREIKAVDQQVDSEVGRKDNQPDQHTQASSSGQVRDNVAISRGKTSTGASAKGVFADLWATANTIHINPITYSDSAFWIPNAIGLQTLCQIVIPMVARTKYVREEQRTFIPYMAEVALYYLYYIFILRAKEAAGQLTGREATALTRFKKAHPEEKITIPEPFIPFFYTIVATQLEDRKYSWVCPTYGDLSHFNSFENTHDSMTLNYLRPNIPFMLGLLNSIRRVDGTNFEEYFDDNNIYRPVAWNAADGTVQQVRLFNRNITRDNTAMTDNVLMPMCSLGFSSPFQFWNENGITAIENFKRSGFVGQRTAITANTQTTGIDITITTPHPNPKQVAGTNFLQTKDCSQIDDFLFLEKTKNAHWADPLFESLNVVAKHFKNNMTLADMPSVGGMECSMLCDLRTPGTHTHGAAPLQRYKYANPRLGYANRDELDFGNFVDGPFTGLQAYFRTTRADVTREEQLQGITLGTNAIPPITIDADVYAQIREGDFFSHMNTNAHTIEATNIGEIGVASTAVKGVVDMYQGLDVNFVRPRFISKPE